MIFSNNKRKKEIREEIKKILKQDEDMEKKIVSSKNVPKFINYFTFKI